MAYHPRWLGLGRSHTCNLWANGPRLARVMGGGPTDVPLCVPKSPQPSHVPKGPSTQGPHRSELRQLAFGCQ